MCAKSLQSRPTLCSPMDCSSPSCCPGNSPGKNAEVGCPALLQGIFLTQGSNPCLLHCRQSLYHLSYQGSPILHVGEIKRQYSLERSNCAVGSSLCC